MGSTTTYVLKYTRNRNILYMKYKIIGIQKFKCCTPDGVLIRVLIWVCMWKSKWESSGTNHFHFEVQLYVYVLKNKRNGNILHMKYKILSIQKFRCCTPDEIRCINKNNYSNKKKIISSCCLLKGELTCVLMK